VGIDFVKMQGTGNDFVLLDQKEEAIDLSQQQIALICHRRFGIGADGLLILRSSAEVDFEMLYYNADGAPSSMCGNGGRCIVKYAFDQGYIGSKSEFLAPDGIHKARVMNDEISLEMQNVSEVTVNIQDYTLDTGSPHYVTFVKSLSTLNVTKAGRQVRNSDQFKKEGINVNFVELMGANKLFVRTYERGVEDETLSCGTGVTAAAIAAQLKQGIGSTGDWNISAKGGELRVSFKFEQGLFSQVELHGPAAYVFTGVFELNVNS